ncbi:MAG: hypothetical protein H0X16_00170 [Chloroflexi bacterium]|nr:hypothetical protein [Chloroflexota bacterium]
MSLKLYRPGRDGLEPAPVEQRSWRRRLRSPRWRAAALTNPEAQPTSPLAGVVFFGALALLTFVLLVAGYGTGFWGS